MYIYTYRHTYINLYLHTYIHSYIHVYIYKCIHTSVWIIHVCISIKICNFIFFYV